MQNKEIKRLQELAGIVNEAIVERTFIIIDRGEVFMLRNIKIDDSSRSKTFDLLLKILSKMIGQRIKPHDLELIIPKKDEVRVLPMQTLSGFEIATLDSPGNRMSMGGSNLQKCIIMVGGVAFIATIDKSKDDDEMAENVYVVLAQDMPRHHIDIDDIEIINTNTNKIKCYQVVISGELM